MKNITGQKFGRLTALERVGKNSCGHSIWRCQCECGRTTEVVLHSLTCGKTRSCGCLDYEAHITHPNRRTHRACGTRLYRIWKKMKSRCHNPNDPDYQHWYGSKGVCVCSEWFYNFWIFRNWSILHGYKDNLTIDRINPCGNYEPSNCRWATALEQARNKRGGDPHS